MSAFSFRTKLALVTTIMTWASSFVFIRIGLTGLSPGSLALLRIFCAALCMTLVYIALPRKTHFSISQIFIMLFVGAFGVGMYNLALNYGEITVSSGIASFIISQMPVIAIILAISFLNESLPTLGWLGLSISIIGVALISLSEAATSHENTMGIIYTIIATLLGGLYSSVQKPLLKKTNALELTCYIMWGGLLSLIFYTPHLLHELPHASFAAIAAAIYLGVVPAALGYLAWSYALTEIPVSCAVSFLYLMPIIATLMGWAMIHEVPKFISLGGGLLALAGAWLINSARYRSTKTPRTPKCT